MSENDFSREENESNDHYLSRMDEIRIRLIEGQDGSEFHSFCNSVGYIPQGEHELFLYEQGAAEYLSIGHNNCSMSQTTKQPNIYYSHPSEVIDVPKRSKIRSALKNSFRGETGSVPSDLNEWSISRCYATYFDLLNVVKFDPKKHPI